MARRWLLPLTLLVLLVLLALMWQWLSMQGLLTVDTLMTAVRSSMTWLKSPWGIPVILVLYAGLSLIMFPLSLLVAATGLIFGPWWGFGYALAGTLCASMLTWWVGRKIGRDALLRHGGQRLHGLSRYLAGRGVRTMVVVNLLPLAPFTLTNMMAGAFHLKFRDYMVGSILGIIPGLAGVTLLGSQLGQLVNADSRNDALYAIAGLLVGIALLMGLKFWAERKKAKRRS